MKKTWLYSAVAGIALVASACGNNASDYNRSNGTATQNFAGGPGGVFDSTTRSTNFYPNGYTAGSMRNYSAFNGTGMRGAGAGSGTSGMFGGGGDTGMSLYRSGGMTMAGAGQNGAGMNRMEQMGYFRVDRNAMQTNSTAANQVYLDRNALAQIVGNVTASCPGVNASTVLVTDEEVFVGLDIDQNNAASGQTGGQNAGQAGSGMGTMGQSGGQNAGQAGGRTGGETNYQANGGTLGNQTMAQTVKAQARMNAMSVCPRYYKVYVTDDQQMIDELTRIASTTHYTYGNGVNDNQLNTERTIDSLVSRMGGLPDGQDMAGRGSTMSTNMHRMQKAGTTAGSNSR